METNFTFDHLKKEALMRIAMKLSILILLGMSSFTKPLFAQWNNKGTDQDYWRVNQAAWKQNAWLGLIGRQSNTQTDWTEMRLYYQDAGNRSDGTLYFYQGLNGAHNEKARLTSAGDFVAQRAIYTNDWFRVYGSNGIFWQNHGGGWYMTDATWMRLYNSKSLHAGPGVIRTDSEFRLGQLGEKFKANSSGKVGINLGRSGTTAHNPDGWLEIKGSAANARVKFGGTGGDAHHLSSDRELVFNSDHTGNSVAFSFRGANFSDIAHAPGEITGAPTELMAINGNGNVGLGVTGTSIKAKLDINAKDKALRLRAGRLFGW